ncbi:hypothetical protein MD588_19315 [Photobacterium sp. SDRW27]|uniref:hypothetical protein n=1 Tax=Photobacterium obscurum TaxID=2829490 RepID=UPI002244C628|nr:hypothetical protein [Photobacterium obscurum]MCW8330947.1 hypothetical protein [Photobacterium obscurum]
MLQLIAAIPTIITAISKVSELFDQGKETVENITGNVSQASTPDELRTEVESLTTDQQNRWAEVMAKQVDMYAKQNERLAVEIGLVDANITGKLTTDAANEIAVLRMTTRPWTVRLMVHYVLFPFYLVIIDLIQNILVTWLPFLSIKPFNSFEYVFGVMRFPEKLDDSVIEKLAELFSQNGAVPATFAGQLYMESIPWVVSIIIGYMGLREVGKARAHKDAEAPLAGPVSPISVVSKSLTNGISLVEKIRNWFK